MTASALAGTLLEKLAVDNGFDRELPPDGPWLAFGSTAAPLRVWLRPEGVAGAVVALSQANVARELDALAPGLVLPKGAVGARFFSVLPEVHRFLRRALQAGADGFVVKDTPARQLSDALRRVHAGLRVVDPALAADSLLVGESPLTARETDVLRLARDGSSAAAIAGALYLSEGTVRNHLSAAIGKTGARNRTEAVRAAEEYGWL